VSVKATGEKETMRARNRKWIGLAAAALFAASGIGFGVLEGTAHAIIGMPLTPMSFAGVARRTTRRAVVYGAAARPYGYGYYGW
jgi:hypothetical protein